MLYTKLSLCDKFKFCLLGLSGIFSLNILTCNWSNWWFESRRYGRQTVFGPRYVGKLKLHVWQINAYLEITLKTCYGKNLAFQPWKNMIWLTPSLPSAIPAISNSKESACNAGDLESIPESGRSLEKGMGMHSSILAWRIPWTEKPGRLQSMGWQRIRHDWAHNPLSPPPGLCLKVTSVRHFLTSYNSIPTFTLNLYPVFLSFLLSSLFLINT